MSENKADQPIEKSDDRRSLRSQKALIEALIELMAVKTYDSISIKEIVEKADVGRSTFYAHYQTKDDLVKSGFERLLDETLDHIGLTNDGQDLQVDVTGLFQHAEGHYHLFKTLMWGAGLKILMIEEHTVFSEKLLQRLSPYFPDQNAYVVPLNVLCISLAGNLLLLLKWWLENKMPYSPEKMNEMFQVLVLPGIRSALKKPTY